MRHAPWVEWNAVLPQDVGDAGRILGGSRLVRLTRNPPTSHDVLSELEEVAREIAALLGG